jgi:hypothetical protein
MPDTSFKQEMLNNACDFFLSLFTLDIKTRLSVVRITLVVK